MRRSTTSSLLRSINRSAILDLIRERGPIARTQIAEDLDVSLPTVMRAVEELMDENLVKSHGKSESTRGRPRPLIEFNPSAYAIIGLDLGSSQMIGAVTNLAGEIQHKITVPSAADDPQGNLDQVYRLIDQLLSVPLPEGQSLRGIGIGVPGVVALNEGTVIWAPSLGWRDLALRDRLQERLGVAAFLENDVNLAALGELSYGGGRGAQNLVCITIGTGIGAGIIIGGGLYRGHHQAAGEIGYLLPSIEHFGTTYDQFGALEYFAGGLGIVRRTQQRLEQESQPKRASLGTMEQVFQAARNGEVWAQRVVADTVDYISLSVAAVSALLDPEVIILGGHIASSADLLIQQISTRIQGVVPFAPRFVASPLGQDAAIKGASILVLNGTMDNVRIKQFS